MLGRPIIIGGGGAQQVSPPRQRSGGGGPMTLLYDSFNDGDGSELSSHTMNTGSGWTGWTGDFQIYSNTATQVSDTYDGPLYTADAGHANVSAQVNVYTYPDDFDLIGLVLRFQDTSNYWVAYISTARSFLRLSEVNGGVETVRAETSWSGSAGTQYLLEAVVDGSSLSVSQGATNVSYSSSFLSDKTLFGIISNITSSFFDDFLVVG